MKVAKADLGYLKWSAAFLGVVVLACAGVGTAIYYLTESAQKQHRIVQAQRTESQGKLNRAAQEEVELREKTARFLELQAQGYVGRENRLDWIEQLARLSHEQKLTDFQYEFMPQKAVDPLLIPSATVAGTHRFLMTPQRLSTKILHEGDLLAFLEKLRRNVKAYIVVQHCHIERLPPRAGDKPAAGIAPQLSAECELNWITLQGPQ